MATRLGKRKQPRREDKPFKERLKIAGHVLDDPTLMVLVKWINGKLIKSVDYPLSEGKEALVFRATAGEKLLPRLEKGQKFVAIKVFKYDTSSFIHMSKYIEGDPRFYSVKHSRRPLVRQWAGKEFANLKTAYEAGAPVPKPFMHRENCIAMEFIGTFEGLPYALLQDVVVQEPGKVFRKIMNGVRKFYSVKLVHADLSPYNILMRHTQKEGDSIAEQPVFIDVGQSVLLAHPNSKSFLVHDMQTVCECFRKLGVQADWEKELEKIVGPEEDLHQAKKKIEEKDVTDLIHRIRRENRNEDSSGSQAI